jgi:predicted RNase H-like nuclease
MTRNLVNNETASIVGIDLAWGDKKPDGLCFIRANRTSADVVEVGLSKGDKELTQWIASRVPDNEAALLAIDAPLVVPNATGGRPVDRQISIDFGKYHAGCHSANSQKCARPLRIANLLRSTGYLVDFDLNRAARIATEVYPHPAMIRLFEIERIIKYKKGLVATKRQEFRRLQDSIITCLVTDFSEVTIATSVSELLRAPWSKNIEDQTDALFCALIGYSHWRTKGETSEVVGALDTGFILLPPLKSEGYTLIRWPSGKPMVTTEYIRHLRDQDPYL